MKKQIHTNTDLAILREKAIELLIDKPAKMDVHRSEADVLKLLQNLEVYQVELEMQNNELMLANEHSEADARKYAELYNRSLSCYFTLSREGEIIELNLNGAKLLNRDCHRLINSRFGFFISESTKPIFNEFLGKVFESKGEESCEVTLLTDDNIPKYIVIKGIVAENDEHCFATVYNLTQHKQETEEILRGRQQLEMVLKASGAGTWDWDMTTQRLGWSKELFILFGLDPDGPEATFELWKKVLHPDDRVIAVEYIDFAVREKVQLSSEYRIILPDGQVRWISALGNTFYSASGQPLRMAGICTDITKRKHQEELLEESEEKFRKLFEDNLTGNFLTNGEGIISDCNPSFVDIFGYENKQEIIGKHITILYNDSSEFELIKADLRKHKKIKDYEAIRKCKNGDLINVIENKVAGFSPEGEIIEIKGYIYNITRQKHVEKELRESREAFKEYFEMGSIGMCITSREKGWLEVNARLCQILGYTKEELFQYNWAELTHPDDLAEDIELFNQVIEGKRNFYSIDKRFLHKDGSFVYGTLCVSCRRNANGTVNYMLASLLDITENKRAEKLLRETNQYLENLVNYANAPIIVWDPQFRITRFNHAFEVLTGRSEAEVSGQSLELLFPPELVSSYMDLIRSKVISGERLEKVEIKILRRDASVCIVLWNSATIFEPDKVTPIATIAQGYDITERTQVQEEIIRLNAELEQRVKQRTFQLENSNKELEAFAYSVSHDLRSPLRGIDGWSLALLEDYSEILDDKGRMYLVRVRSEAQRMGCLIDDLLLLSRITRDDMHEINIDLNDLAKTIISRLKEANPGRQIEFVVEPGLFVSGDITMLDIALTNLFDNACKFTKNKPVARIEFGKKEAGSKPTFFIRDNGVGFEMEYTKKLFSAFQRLHKSSEFPGTGIGLAIVQRVITRHGGRIWAESITGEGATFYFTL